MEGKIAENVNAILVRRLEQVGELGEAERLALMGLPAVARTFRAGEDIVAEGQTIEHCCLLTKGFTYRYRQLRDGKRQIIGFHVPGDIPDLQSLHIHRMDHGLAASETTRVVFITHDDIWALCRRYARISELLWTETLIDAAIFREWIIQLGRRTAMERTAHLLCEITMRLEAVGISHDKVYWLPLTQSDLGDALGLTTVTVNRVLQAFRQDGLIERERSRLTINDWGGLSRIAGFEARYLHLRTTIPMGNAQDLGA